MSDLPPYPDSNGDTGTEPSRESTPSTPRWVKVFGLIALVLVLLFGVLRLTGVGGAHGPGRHMPSGNGGSDTLPSSGLENTGKTVHEFTLGDAGLRGQITTHLAQVPPDAQQP